MISGRLAKGRRNSGTKRLLSCLLCLLFLCSAFPLQAMAADENSRMEPEEQSTAARADAGRGSSISEKGAADSDDIEETPNTWRPAVEKILEGAEETDEEFTFTISVEPEDDPNVVLPEPASLTIQGAGTAHFDAVEFTAPGIYTFEIREVPGTTDGMTYDDTVWTVTVPVEGTENAPVISRDEIVFSYNPEDPDDTAEGISFKNVFAEPEPSPTPSQTPEPTPTPAPTATPAPVVTPGAGGYPVVNLTAHKTVQAADGFTYTLPVGAFDFTLTPASVNPVADPVKETLHLSNAEDGTVPVLINAVYTEPGVYYYVLEENFRTVPGMQYSDLGYLIIVTVTSNGTSLDAEVSAMDEEGELLTAADLQFLNVYNPQDISVVLSGTKVLDGMQMRAGEFAFRIAPVSAIVEPDAETQTANAPDEEEAEASPSPEPTDEDTDKPAATSEIPAAASVVLPLTAVPMPEVDTVTNTIAGTFHFGAIHFTRPGTYSYTVKEVPGSEQDVAYDTSAYTVVITVQRDKDGVLTAKEEIQGADALIFRNVRNQPSLVIEKSQSRNSGQATTSLIACNAADILTYRLVVTNPSSVTAQNAIVTDKFPTGLVLLPETISGGGTFNTDRISWSLGDIEPGGQRIVTFNVRVPYVSTNTRWQNVASVSYANNPENAQDGTRAEVPSNIVQADTAAQTPNAAGYGQNTNTTAGTSPGTNDTTNLGLWTALLFISAGAGVAALWVLRRNSRTSAKF